MPLRQERCGQDGRKEDKHGVRILTKMNSSKWQICYELQKRAHCEVSYNIFIIFSREQKLRKVIKVRKKTGF